MKIKYCLPIVVGTKKEVIHKVEQNLDYDFFEIWLDYIDDIDKQFPAELIKKFENKEFIFLFRRKNLENPKIKQEIKFEIIDALKEKNSYLDLDINDQITELEYIKANNINIKKIISYHNYEATPDETELIKIINFMNKFEPFIVKIAAKCNSDIDALRLMTLIHILNEKKLNFIVTGMGISGKIVRVYGMLNGNFVNFAPVSTGEATADGQILKKDLQTIADIFDNK